MSTDALGFLLDLPAHRVEPLLRQHLGDGVAGFDRTMRVLLDLAWHADQVTLHVWVSDRTQQTTLGIDRRTVREIREGFERAGLLTFTGRKGQRGVRVFRLNLEPLGYVHNPVSGQAHPPTEPSTSGRASGQASGRASGRVSGQAHPPQTEQNLNRTSSSEWTERHEELLHQVIDLDLATQPTSAPRDKLEARKRDAYGPYVSWVISTFPASQWQGSLRDVALCVLHRAHNGQHPWTASHATWSMLGRGHSGRNATT